MRKFIKCKTFYYDNNQFEFHACYTYINPEYIISFRKYMSRKIEGLYYDTFNVITTTEMIEVVCKELEGFKHE